MQSVVAYVVMASKWCLLICLIGIVLGKFVIGCNGCNEKEEIFLSWKFCSTSFSLLVLREIILLENFLNV